MVSKPKDVQVLSIIAILVICRIWGVFLLLPVLPALLPGYTGASHHLVGWAVGAYGFFQALLQLPLSMWSDRIGRRPVIIIGFGLLAFGSLLAGITHNIYLIIVGRCLQGAGAIGSCLIALVGDYLGPGKRAVGVAIIGGGIGVAFMTALLLGPWLVDYLGLAGLFYAIVGLGVMGVLIAWRLLPEPRYCSDLLGSSYRDILRMVVGVADLWYLNFSVFIIHAILAGLFFVIDLFSPDWPRWQFGWALLLGFVVVAALSSRFDRDSEDSFGLLCGFSALLFGLLGLWYYLHFGQGLLGVLAVFFAGFALLEMLLPAKVIFFAPAGGRGAAMGLFAMSQFSGVFIGAVLGGAGVAHFGKPLVVIFLICCSGLGVLLWCWRYWVARFVRV